MLHLENTTAAYPELTVFENLSLSVGPGEVVAVVGRSGCGKTTLVQVAAGLLQPLTGRVTLSGETLYAGDHRIGFVQQHYGLFPWFTAVGNVELGLKLRGVPAAERRERARAALAELGIGTVATRFPAELSGGEAQRVALARTSALDPAVLLLDEPFSSLDAFAREALQEDLLRLQDTHRRTTLLVTHSLEEAAFLADRIGIMHRRPAALELIENPWPVPRAERTHAARSDDAFGAAVGEVRRRFEEAAGGE
jgi:ABC-type nitrate/sulfonate/bicarbonate transport system ATPase subunit